MCAQRKRVACAVLCAGPLLKLRAVPEGDLDY